MYFEQFYLGCLAHASYIFASQGEAVVVDPQRDVDLSLIHISSSRGQAGQHRRGTECHRSGPPTV